MGLSVLSAVVGCSTFQAATDLSANQIALCIYTQIHYCDATWTLSNEIAFVIQVRKTHMSKSLPAVGDLKMLRKATLSLRLRDIFCNNKQEELGKSLLISGKRFDWLQAASTKMTPPYVRHSLRHPSVCSMQYERGVRDTPSPVYPWVQFLSPLLPATGLYHVMPKGMEQYSVLYIISV